MKPVIVCLVGPSCSGKSHLEGRLVTLHGFQRVISHTTRPIRPGLEANGDSYHFVDSMEFDRMVTTKAFVEHNTLHTGHRYGVSYKAVDPLIASKAKIVMTVDPNGAVNMQRYAESIDVPCIIVYMMAKVETLVKRMLLRYNSAPENEQTIEQYSLRIANLFREELNWGNQMVFHIGLRDYGDDNAEEIEKFLVGYINNLQRGIFHGPIENEKPKSAGITKIT